MKSVVKMEEPVKVLLADLFNKQVKKTWESFSHYSQESTIHSLSYIGKKNIHWVERIFWITAFVFSITSCSYLVYRTYEKWENDPMIVTFKERSTPTWEIPFPAITICSESKTDVDKFNLSEVIRMVDSNETLNSEESMRLEALYQVCTILVNKTDEIKCNFVKTLREVSNGFADISSVQIAKIKKTFKSVFQETITGDGVCYTFNMLNYKDLFKKNMNPSLKFPKESPRSNWSVFGYENNEPLTYPVRVLGSGKKAGISISLNMRKKDIDYACKKVANGFRLTFHTPDELPQTDSYYLRIPFNAETLISIEPRVMTTSKNLKHYKPKQRQCYFSGEKRLKFFKAYTQSNCKLECLTEFILKRCGCVKFSLPHSSETKVCGRSKLSCVEESETLLVLLELGQDVKEKTETSTNKLLEELEENFLAVNSSNDELSESFFGNDTYDQEDDDDDEPAFEFDSCKCLPSCSSIHYDAEISRTKINVRKHLRANQVHDIEEDSSIEYAFVTIYFKEDHFIESKRSELYGWSNFLSNCGGFMGLLMGCSFLSIVEIIYHLTLRKIFRSKTKI